MRTLSPLPWLCTVATTLPPLRNGEPILTLSPCPTSSTLSNSTLAPASAVSFSTRKTEPSLTRYCLPPVEITAYMSTRAPEGPGTRPQKGVQCTDSRGQWQVSANSVLSAVSLEAEGGRWAARGVLRLPFPVSWLTLARYELRFCQKPGRRRPARGRQSHSHPPRQRRGADQSDCRLHHRQRRKTPTSAGRAGRRACLRRQRPTPAGGGRNHRIHSYRHAAARRRRRRLDAAP